MSTIRQISNQEFQPHFTAGFDAKQEEIKWMGFEAARNKFNMDNPVGYKPSSPSAYYYAEGEMAALIAAKK